MICSYKWLNRKLEYVLRAELCGAPRRCPHPLEHTAPERPSPTVGPALDLRCDIISCDKTLGPDYCQSKELPSTSSDNPLRAGSLIW